MEYYNFDPELCFRELMAIARGERPWEVFTPPANPPRQTLEYMQLEHLWACLTPEKRYVLEEYLRGRIARELPFGGPSTSDWYWIPRSRLQVWTEGSSPRAVPAKGTLFRKLNPPVGWAPQQGLGTPNTKVYLVAQGGPESNEDGCVGDSLCMVLDYRLGQHVAAFPSWDAPWTAPFRAFIKPHQTVFDNPLMAMWGQGFYYQSQSEQRELVSRAWDSHAAKHPEWGLRGSGGRYNLLAPFLQEWADQQAQHWGLALPSPPGTARRT